MFPFWVEVSMETMLQLSVMGLAGLMCVVQSLLMFR